VSFKNLNGASKTLANRIWNAIKNDKQANAIIQNPEQITFLSPKDAVEQKPPQISVYLYNITELTSMRNQPTQTQNPSKPPLYLNLRYLITPITNNADDDQAVLGKILQIFHETPVLRGSDLQGSLSEGGEELKVMLDQASVDELSKIWSMLSAPYRLSVSYTVYPVRIEPTVKPDSKQVAVQRPKLTVEKTPVKA
jgi:hypothetical protein